MALPASITGVIGWWDASVTASMSLTGSSINSIADQSGAGNNLSWDSFAKPTYNATGFNSRPAIVLGGQAIGDSLIKTGFALGTGNTLTLFWVGKLTRGTAGTDNPAFFSYTGAGQSNDWASPNSFSLCAMYGSSTQITIFRNGNAAINCASDVNRRIIVTIDATGKQTFYIDGVPQTGATTVGNWSSPGTLRIGRSASGGFWAGPSGEFGISTNWHDPTSVAQLDKYLQDKWVPSYSPIPGMANVLGWWDASITASMTLSGSDILAVADQSGAGNNLSWAGWGKPVYNATGFNSNKPAFMLNGIGIGNSFAKTGFALGTGNTLTLWWVGKIETLTTYGNGGIFSYTGAGQTADWNNANSFLFYQPGASATLLNFTRTSTNRSFNHSANLNHRIIVTVSSAGVTTMYVDGIAQTVTPSISGNWTSPGTLFIGRDRGNGNLDGGSANYSSGPIAEMGISSDWIDATTAGQLDNALGLKWGLIAPPIPGARLSQASIEEWGTNPSVPMNVTQIAVEQWSTGLTGTLMVTTQMAIEVWGRPAFSEPPKPKDTRAMIMA